VIGTLALAPIPPIDLLKNLPSSRSSFRNAKGHPVSVIALGLRDPNFEYQLESH
jgi:hypothetical protein